MQAFAVIVGLMAIALFFYYRAKAESDMTGRIGIPGNGAPGRAIRRIAGSSPIANIGDPITAAATLMVSMQSEEFVLGDGDEEIIEKLLLNIGDKNAIEAAMDYAKWAAIEVADAKFTIDRLGKYLRTQLDDSEKVHFLELLDEANQKIGGCYDFGSSRMRLARKMGLEVAR